MELQPVDFQAGERCSGPVAGGAEGERRGKPGCGRSYRSDQGAVGGSELQPARNQAPSPTSDYREGARRSPTRSTRSSSAFSRWTGRSAPFSSARAASSVWNCWARRTCLKDFAKIIRSFAFEVLNDEDLGSVPEDVATVLGGHAGGPVQAPLARGAVTSGSTRAR